MSEPVETRQVIDALKRLLYDVGTDEVFAYLHRLKVPWSLSQRVKDGDVKFYARLYIQRGEGIPGEDMTTVREYSGTGISPSRALVTALANFLRAETCDYHDYTETTRL